MGRGRDGTTARTPPPPSTPCWLTNILVVVVVVLVGVALGTGLVYGWAAVAVLVLAAILVLGTAATPESRTLASQLVQAMARRKPPGV